jgi:hypothetical protein
MLSFGEALVKVLGCESSLYIPTNRVAQPSLLIGYTPEFIYIYTYSDMYIIIYTYVIHMIYIYILCIHTLCIHSALAVTLGRPGVSQAAAQTSATWPGVSL